ncbi:MAG: YXWGXW repeat-containing protein [Desulfovibrio sp.]|jgi:hypothetical protein|nr:YXWGXW repeat-containing protein [Desulfovibrio sp.]
MRSRGLKTLLATLLCLGCFAAPAFAQLSISINIGDGPPPPRYEVVPRPRGGWIWVPGVWYWEAGRYNWAQGHWIKARPGQRWVPARWEHRGDHYRYEAGGWEPIRWEPAPPVRREVYVIDRDDDDRHPGRGRGNAWGRKKHDRDWDDDGPGRGHR